MEEDDSAVWMSDEDDDVIDDCCGATSAFFAILANFRKLGNDRALDEDEENAATSLQERLPRRKSVAIIVIFMFIILAGLLCKKICANFALALRVCDVGAS